MVRLYHCVCHARQANHDGILDKNELTVLAKECVERKSDTSTHDVM